MRERRNVGERWWKEDQRVRGWQKKRLLRRARKKLRAIANRPSRCAFSANRVFDTRRRDHSRISWHPIVFRIVQTTRRTISSIFYFASSIPYDDWNDRNLRQASASLRDNRSENFNSYISR